MSILESPNICPIENKRHPRLNPESEPVETLELPENELEDGELAEYAFGHPDIFRQSILENVRVENIETFHGKSFACVWPTKFCPVGCDCCFFKSPKCAGTEHAADNTITPEGREKLIRFINDANVREFVIAGGGEPFLERELMKQIAAHVDAEKLFFLLAVFGLGALNRQRP
jgi:hypothetical protein